MISEIAVIKNNIALLNKQMLLKDNIIVYNDSNAITEIINQLLIISGIDIYVFMQNTDTIEISGQNTNGVKYVYDLSDVDGTFLIISRREKEIRERLRAMGKTVCFSLINYQYFDFLNNKMNLSFPKLELGEVMLQSVLNESYDDILIFPSKSIGDTYLPARTIKRIEGRRIAAIATSGTAGTILNPFTNVEIKKISLSAIRGVELFFWANYSNLPEVIYMFPHPFENPCVGIGFWITQAAGYTFMDVCGTVFAGKDRELIKENTRTEYRHDDDRIDRLFIDNGLIKGKTVILIPNANSMSELRNDFWEELAAYLSGKGYSVCTGTGSIDEEPIRNTCGVFVRIDDFREFVKQAGHIVTVRCGLCDLLDGELIGNKKIILYVDRDMRYSSWFNYNDLEKDGFDQEVAQLIVKKDDVFETVEMIRDIVESWWD